MTEKAFIKTDDLAKYFNVHQMTINRWVNKGIIPAFKLGGRWYADKEVIKKHIQKLSKK